jgi:hypothetical protein
MLVRASKQTIMANLGKTALRAAGGLILGMIVLLKVRGADRELCGAYSFVKSQALGSLMSK